MARPSAARRVLILAIAAAGAVWARCDIYDGSLVQNPESDAAADAGPSNDASADVDLCDHAEPPLRPAQDDPSDADIEFVNALNTVDFGLDGGVYGFDLDHVCTCPGPESCVPQSGAPQHCDDSRGRDNAGGALIAEFSALTSDLNANKINTNIGNGLYTMVLRITGYNGTANDTQVNVSVLVSNGTLPLSDGGVNPIPKHDGNDAWGIDPTSLIGTPPPYVAANEDDSAYVTNNSLVASVSFPFGLGQSFGSDFLKLDGAFLVATISHPSSGYALAGVITGRWDTRNLLTGIQGVKDPLNPGQFLCGTDPTYLTFKNAICNASDISRIATSDNTNAPCDAISIALGFTSESAQLGGLYPRSASTTPCGATYSDQCGN